MTDQNTPQAIAISLETHSSQLSYVLNVMQRVTDNGPGTILIAPEIREIEGRDVTLFRVLTDIDDRKIVGYALHLVAEALNDRLPGDVAFEGTAQSSTIDETLAKAFAAKAGGDADG